MPSNPYFLVQPDGDRSFHANPCNSLLISFHDSRMSLLPVQEKEATPPTTENRIMAHIFNECQNYGFEITGDKLQRLLERAELVTA